MNQQPIVILIPSHGLEDFPTDCNEEEAAGLLNAFSATWHPALMKATQHIPDWDRADLPLEELAGRLIVVPSVSINELPSGWKNRALEEGATLVEKISDREPLIKALLSHLPSEEEQYTEQYTEQQNSFIADFIALGTCYLLVQLLTRKMHHYTELDEEHFAKRAVQAANDFSAGNFDDVKRNLNICFELLLEARERCYAIECYLIDLCLLIPRLANAHLEARLKLDLPLSLFVTTEDLKEIFETKPEIGKAIQEAIRDEKISLIGGQWSEGATPLQPLASTLWQLRKGHDELSGLLDSEALKNRTTSDILSWGVRRFSLSTALPQLINFAGIKNGVHWAFDDGLFPMEEQSLAMWEGRDGSTIHASSRLPLSADSAVSFLRFAEVMSESMDGDHIAMLSLAHWSEVKTPWLGDLYRISQYAPVLGKWMTLHDFLEESEPTEHVWMQNQHAYRTPYLSQSVAKIESNPISRYEAALKLRRQFDALQTMSLTATLLQGKPIEKEAAQQWRKMEDQLEELSLLAETAAKTDPDKQTTCAKTLSEKLSEKLEQRLQECGQQWAAVFKASTFNLEQTKSEQTEAGKNEALPLGLLVLNPVSSRRNVVVKIPMEMNPPVVDGAVKYVQCDQAIRQAVVELPGFGFAWIPAGETKEGTSPQKGPLLAEELTLRNEHFEVRIHPDMGTISELKNYGRHPNRIGQQIAFHYPSERSITQSKEDPSDITVRTTAYSIMAADHIEITSDGPALGEIVATGRLVDPGSGETLSKFRQATRVWRGCSHVEIEIDLEPTRIPKGNPWQNYYCARFAYPDASSHLSGCSCQNTFSLSPSGTRIESTEFIEVATESTRTTIYTQGRPFAAKNSSRMIDSILQVEGETQTNFKFQISVEEPFPVPAGIAHTTDPICIPLTEKAPATSTGWLFHLNAKNVTLSRLLPPFSFDNFNNDSTDKNDAPARSIVVELTETEGTYRTILLQTFFTPTSAKLVNLLGKELMPLEIKEGAIEVEMRPYEVTFVEVTFS